VQAYRVGLYVEYLLFISIQS